MNGAVDKGTFRALFDKNGRRIPPKDLRSSVCGPDTSFRLGQCEISYNERLERLVRFFPQGIKFVPVEEFQDRSEALLEQLRQDELLSNLLNGEYFPICLPHFKIADYGKDLEEVFLKAVENSYADYHTAPRLSRKFYNLQEGERNKVYIVEGSRHDHLIARMADKPVVGIQFFPLEGFSINADREQMDSLPESLILSGAIDIATAITAYPGSTRNWVKPGYGYECAANYGRSVSDDSFCFWARTDVLTFLGARHIDYAGDNGSGGLLFLG